MFRGKLAVFLWKIEFCASRRSKLRCLVRRQCNVRFVKPACYDLSLFLREV